MLSSDMQQAQGRIEIVDFSTQAVEACLRFMYSGELKVKLESLVEVAALADKYAIDELKEFVKCVLTLRSKIGIQEIRRLTSQQRTSSPCVALQLSLRLQCPVQQS